MQHKHFVRKLLDNLITFKTETIFSFHLFENVPPEGNNWLDTVICRYIGHSVTRSLVEIAIIGIGIVGIYYHFTSFY